MHVFVLLTGLDFWLVDGACSSTRFIETENVDYPGRLLLKQTNVSILQCAHACEKDKRCEGASYSAEKKQCKLKTKLDKNGKYKNNQVTTIRILRHYYCMQKFLFITRTGTKQKVFCFHSTRIQSMESLDCLFKNMW